jgi:Ras-related protein Rab-1A
MLNLKERYRTITPSYYGTVDAVVIVYDMSARESFSNISYWLKEIEKYANPNMNIVLIGNKLDLANKRMVSYSTLKSFAERYNFLFYETSAKIDDSNILNSFVDITKRLENNLELVKTVKKSDTKRLSIKF